MVRLPQVYCAAISSRTKSKSTGPIFHGVRAMGLDGALADAKLCAAISLLAVSV
jgi:hypothetical protein